MEADTVEQSIHIAETKHPDAVLMDTELVFSDSFSKMRKMRKCEVFKEVPFILLSGHAQDDIRLMALAAGATDFFVKPVNLELLENTLKSHLPNKDQIGNPGDFQ
jgi:DNA-binding response OmpR family regulator